MNDKQKRQLNQMISENDVEDQTDMIRTLNHSALIRADVVMLEALKVKNSADRVDDPTKFTQTCIFHCSFLYTNYPDIFEQMLIDKIDLEIFGKFVDVIERIENDELDHHEGSFEVGKLLKRMYVDSALRRAERTAHGIEGTEEEDSAPYREPVKISWKEFKTMSPDSSI
tara:strand:+ start:289 stop:798 length:510 start_codon:yes stop_codon:yes gene_type:complete